MARTPGQRSGRFAQGMQNFGFKMFQFMQGRNGFDSIARFAFIVAIILMFVDMFARTRWINLVGDLIAIYAIYRCLSKNVVKRRAESAKFDVWMKGPKESISLSIKRFKNRKTTKYFKCEKCKTVYSAPKGKGKIRCTCPNCGEKTIRNT